MIGEMDGWTMAALALAVGCAVAIAMGLRQGGITDWARALGISAVAVAISGAAWRTHGAIELWFSGFFICAALHRWADAVIHRSTRG